MQAPSPSLCGFCSQARSGFACCSQARTWQREVPLPPEQRVDQPIDVLGELAVEAPDEATAAVVGHECLLHWPHLAVCCVVVSSVLLTELFDVFIWNFSCTLVDRFTPLGLGWLVPRFALVDRLEVIKSLYGRTAAWPRLGPEDVWNVALQRSVALLACLVCESEKLSLSA